MKIKALLTLLSSLLLIGCSNSKNKVDDNNYSKKLQNSNVLLVYFSITGSDDSFDAVESGASTTSFDGDYYGNTELIAKYIEDETSYDMFKINTVEDYPTTYNELADAAKNQLDNKIRPEIKDLPSQEEINKYDAIILGHPIWWYDLPMPVWTFLENYDLTGKHIYNFFTHAGSSSGANSGSTIEDLTKGAIYHSENRLSIRGTSAASSKSETLNWLNQLKI